MYGSGQWAIPNAMCYGIIRNGQVDGSFVENHTTFRKGKTNIGHAPEKVETLCGVPVRDLRFLERCTGTRRAR